MEVSSTCVANVKSASSITSILCNAKSYRDTLFIVSQISQERKNISLYQPRRKLLQIPCKTWKRNNIWIVKKWKITSLPVIKWQSPPRLWKDFSLRHCLSGLQVIFSPFWGTLDLFFVSWKWTGFSTLNWQHNISHSVMLSFIWFVKEGDEGTYKIHTYKNTYKINKYKICTYKNLYLYSNRKKLKNEV